MGRRKGKLKLELIADNKSRNLTLKRRKESLVKKIKELITLCDVNGCLIVCAPDHDAPITVWGEARRMIDLYRAKKVQDFKNVKMCGVSDFHKKKDDEKAQLVRQSGVGLKNRAQPVRRRIDQLKSKKQNGNQFGPITTTTAIDLDMHNNQHSSTTMMMPRDPPVLMMDDNVNSCCPIGFDEGTSRETTDHELYNVYDYGILGQPMMTWQNDELFMPTGQFDFGGEEKWVDYLQCNINFDDLWVPV